MGKVIPFYKPITSKDIRVETKAMTFGKHKGKDFDDVPASYMLWLWEQDWIEDAYPDVYSYIKKNLNMLQQDAEIQEERFNDAKDNWFGDQD